MTVLGCAKPAFDARGVEYPNLVTPALPVTPPDKPLAATAPPRAVVTPPLAAPLSPSFGAEAFAGDAPLRLERASRDGHWVQLCTERGGSLTRELLTPNEELRIDGLLAADETGRYALLMQQGVLTLWDAETRNRLDLSALGADARSSAESFAELRALSFDAGSEHLLYVRAGQTGKRVVIRKLNDGSEREFDPGPGPIWRARFAPGGTFAIVESIREDSNKNGRADFPAPLLLAPRACSADATRYHTYFDRGDRPVTVLVPLNGDAPVVDPELVMPFGDALVLRDSSGALLLARAGQKRVLEPAACKGRVVHADARRELFIIGCAQKKTGRVSLELVTRSERKPLNIELASLELDREPIDAPRLLALYPGLETVLFDADRRELLPLRSGDVVLATRGGRALVRRANALLFYDADSRTEQPLAVALERYPALLVTPPFVFISPALVNLDSASLVGLSNERPLALSSEGQLLVPSVEADGSRLARGPLRWFTPSL